MPRRDEILSFHVSPAPPGESPWVIEPSHAAIEVVEYDPRWPGEAQKVCDRVRSALGVRALRIEHVGSTAVPRLPAKPVLDLDLTVAEPAAEQEWLPQLQDTGFLLTVREPWWHEHRMLRSNLDDEDGLATNIHVFGPDSPELIRHIVFRNWLRADSTDRELYAETKRAAADGTIQRVMDYNARKEAVIHDIYQRAFRAAGFTP